MLVAIVSTISQLRTLSRADTWPWNREVLAGTYCQNTWPVRKKVERRFRLRI